MSTIDLSSVPAEHRAAIEAQIKADKEQAIKARLARVKEDEETTAKLAAYEALKAKVEAESAEKQAIAKKAEDDKYLKESGMLYADQFNDLKVSDKFAKLSTEEERVEFISELKESKPELFTEQINPLGFSEGYDDGKAAKEEQEGSLIV